MTIRSVHSAHDPRLRATVLSCRPLAIPAGADAAEDRPAWVRSASGLAPLGGFVALIQDDANFVVLLDPDGTPVAHLTLPRGADGLRQFDDLRGNKRLKLDLEACVAVPDPTGPLVLAFGSGSTRAREQVVRVTVAADGVPAAEVLPAPALYETLRAEPRFAG